MPSSVRGAAAAYPSIPCVRFCVCFALGNDRCLLHEHHPLLTTYFVSLYTIIKGKASNSGRGGVSRGERRISIHNPDPAKQAQIQEAKVKRQRAVEYGNNALKAATLEGQLREIKKQAR